jgi:hypothetical protein
MTPEILEGSEGMGSEDDSGSKEDEEMEDASVPAPPASPAAAAKTPLRGTTGKYLGDAGVTGVGGEAETLVILQPIHALSSCVSRLLFNCCGMPVSS